MDTQAIRIQISAGLGRGDRPGAIKAQLVHRSGVARSRADELVDALWTEKLETEANVRIHSGAGPMQVRGWLIQEFGADPVEAEGVVRRMARGLNGQAKAGSGEA